MPIKTIFLMGAPLPGSLDWDHDELLDRPTPPFQDSQADCRPSSDYNTVKWRVLQPLSSIKINNQHASYFGSEDPGFVTTHQLLKADTTSISTEDSILSQFYRHSFNIHETSEIGSRDEDSTQASGSLLDSVKKCTASLSQEISNPTAPRISGPLRDLQDIPTAKYLQSIAPQTMTVNVIVGIIAVHAPRRIVTRQWKKELDIIELVVGDETSSGFGINFWLSPDKLDRLAQSLATLQPQDIILLRTVALGSFRDRVYGQSLRGGMTQVDILNRRPVDTTDAGGFYQVIPPNCGHDDLPKKLRRVREWVLQFVGMDRVGGIVAGMHEIQKHRLPPDTQ
ncbi:hypothetical protein N7495_003910 [Penicillium taxi]|uniref:uncharacterized protein n=1 Tax=Penicillium taxi TaxID=168475 RepID=UPI002545A7FD|nr:uncharacterized protein N7495_003910 [Penicillium taxi]KAJ5899166.1 hypothetical protein N7495_003910 [Penicillium taxi]